MSFFKKNIKFEISNNNNNALSPRDGHAKNAV